MRIAELRVEPKGKAKKLRFGLERFAEDIKDFTPFFEWFRNWLVGYEREQFDTEGRQSGRRWKPLSKRYAKWKAKRYPGKPMLEASGALRESLTDDLDADIGRKRGVYWSGSNVGGYHQSGTKRMPQRAPLDFNKAANIEVGKALHLYVQKQAAQAISGRTIGDLSMPKHL